MNDRWNGDFFLFSSLPNIDLRRCSIGHIAFETFAKRHESQGNVIDKIHALQWMNQHKKKQQQHYAYSVHAVRDVLMISCSLRLKSSATWPWKHAKIEQKHFNHLFWWNCVLYWQYIFGSIQTYSTIWKIAHFSRCSQQRFNVLRQFNWYLNTWDSRLLWNLFWNVNSSNYTNIDKNSNQSLDCHNPMNVCLTIAIRFDANSCSFDSFAVVFFVCHQKKQKPS